MYSSYSQQIFTIESFHLTFHQKKKKVFSTNGKAPLPEQFMTLEMITVSLESYMEKREPGYDKLPFSRD